MIKTMFKKYKRGSLLIEIAVAVAITSMGLLAVFSSFIQIQRVSLRNRLVARANNTLVTQLDLDTRIPYEDLTSSNPPLETVTDLPDAVFTREVTEDTLLQVKTIQYILSWTGASGYQTIQMNHELTKQGIVND